MAKAQAKAGGNSRIRVVMIDAELAEGELAQLIPALQNALRPPAPVIGRIQPKAITQQQPDAATEVVEPIAEEEEEVEVDTAPAQAPARTKGARKPAPKPNVIEIDITSEPPLSSLIDPGNNHRRYLAIAAWLHDHRGIEAVTVDHIYTCYRHLNWPIDIPDFAQPLRELKHKQYFTTSERGKYAVNQLGLAKAAEAASD